MRRGTKIRCFALWMTAISLALAILCAPAVQAQKKADKKKKESAQAQPAPKPQVDTSKLVWPSPPEVARIQWLAQVSSQDDLTPPVPKKKKKVSWMDRLAGISLPEEGERKVLALAKPFGVAADSKGRIYAADTGNSQVFVFDLDKKLVQFLPAKFVMPIAVTLDDADRIFVVDSKQHQVSVLSANWGVEAVFGGENLERPVAAAIDNENRFLYVVDAKASRLAVFDADRFTFLRFLGKPSDPLDPAEGTFATPLGVAVDSEGNVFVSDTLNDRVQMFDADGGFVQMFGKQGVAPGTFMRAKGIAVDADGHVYVTDAEFSNVQVFDAEGRALAVFGTHGTEPGQFSLITGIFIDKQNHILVADQWHARVQVFRYFTEEEAEAARRAKGKSQAPGPAKEAKDSAPK
jgi:DNA-binding beta-propeller fold protein YncE